MSTTRGLSLCRALTIATAFLLNIAATRAADPAPLPLLYHDDFEHGVDHWRATDAAAWKLVDGPKGKAYALTQQSKYEPPFRSPLNFVLLRDVVVSDFTLDVQLHSTARDYGHRDMCLVFGYQDPAKFYYVHFGQKTDDHANQIFIVNGAPRTKISVETTPGTAWDDRWHHVRIVRRVGDGTIEIYFDNLEKPVMRAVDKTFAWGQVGLGSFDDTGEYDDFELRGVRVESMK